MGKGKKKGGRAPAPAQSTGLEASTSALTLEDSQASASTARPISPVQEGLTGDKKIEQKAVPETTAPAEPEEDVGGLGLTGGAKKSRPRKKKPSLAVLEAQAAASAQAGPASQAAKPQQPGQPQFQQQPGHPQYPQQTGHPQFPQQLGQPQFQQQPGHPQYLQQTGHPQFPQQPGQPQFQQLPGHAQFPPQLGQPQFQQQPGHAQFPPQPGHPQFPQQPGQPQFQQQPGQPQWQQRPPHPQGAPQSAPPGVTQSTPWGGQAGPQHPASAPARATPAAVRPPPSAQPGPSYRPADQSQAAGDVKQAPLPRSRQELVCKFSIPAKILGRNVPHQKVMLITNYLPMTIKPLIVHRYDFTFTPDKPKKMIPQVYKIFKDKYLPNETIAFDMYKNGYSLNVLDKKVVEDSTKKESRRDHKIDFTDSNGRVITFTVSLKYTGSVDFTKIHRHMQNSGSSLAVPQEEVQCIDVILRQGTLEAYVKCGRNFFRRPDRPVDLSGGLEMWTGLFQSAIFTSRPYINVDVAHKGFPINQPMLDAFKSFNLDLNRPFEQQMGYNADRFKDFVKNLRVICAMRGGATDGQTREFIVNAVKENPKQLYFEKEDGKKQSVYDYFLNEKRYRIMYPHLPCLWVGVRNKSIYYPMELCTVAYGQALRKQLTDIQLSTMVREAATPPEERKRKIEEVIRNMNYSQNTYFKKFGLDISNQFLQLEAKVLPPPTLNCGEPRGTIPGRGQWNSTKLMKPEALTAWGFIGLELAPHACNYDMIKNLVLQTGRQMGMQVAEPKLCAFNLPMKELRSTLFKAQTDQTRLIFVIVPNRGKDYYHRVKQQAETDVGILTQCIREQTASRRINPQVIKNILLKVNSKLMGINQCLDNKSIPNCIQTGGVMIVGADVTHPSPDQQNIPSIAAVTASIDPKCFIYNIELSIQSPKEEVIKEFAEIMYDHLNVFRQHNNGKIPKKIYVFRDGVSEGQFGQIMNSELSGLLTAYSKFSKEKPEVLFLLVQKRHHTRLFGTDRNRRIVNVEPGTVVDTHIVHPKELDFYLVSHAAIKGTARPTRYHSVCNDGGIPHDEVEQLTFYLCHLYSRCMRSVSYPTPTYYAHLACLRARSLTFGQVFDNKELERSPRRLRVMDKMLRSSRMFFV